MNRLLRLIAIMILLAASAGSVSGQEVREHAMFCRTDGRIAADSSAMRTAEWRNLVVTDFLKYADCPCDVAGLDYCDRYRSMSIDDSTRVSVDCVTFPSGGEALVKWLDGIPDSTYVEIDIPAKAPEKCIAFLKETTLVIVWCNLFADSDKIFGRLYGMNLLRHKSVC